MLLVTNLAWIWNFWKVSKCSLWNNTRTQNFSKFINSRTKQGSLPATLFLIFDPNNVLVKVSCFLYIKSICILEPPINLRPSSAPPPQTKKFRPTKPVPFQMTLRYRKYIFKIEYFQTLNSSIFMQLVICVRC